MPQTLYNLPDEQVENEIRNCISFMRLLGLGLEGAVPDATTMRLYRKALAKAGLVKPTLLNAVPLAAAVTQNH